MTMLPPTRCTCGRIGSDGAPLGCYHEDMERPERPERSPLFDVVEQAYLATHPMPVGVTDDEEF